MAICLRDEPVCQGGLGCSSSPTQRATIPIPGTRTLASLSRVWQRKLAMSVKGGNYWLGPLFLISQAAAPSEPWWGGSGTSMWHSSTRVWNTLSRGLPDLCCLRQPQRPGGCRSAVEPRGVSHESGPGVLIALGPSFLCVEWAH